MTRANVRLWPYVKAGSEFNVIYARDGSATFPAPIFAKLARDQQHYVQISYADFHLNRTTMRIARP
jgi:hypothetical protein